MSSKNTHTEHEALAIPKANTLAITVVKVESFEVELVRSSPQVLIRFDKDRTAEFYWIQRNIVIRINNGAAY